jgi:hypothetical protein
VLRVEEALQIPLSVAREALEVPEGVKDRRGDDEYMLLSY